jgi:hypothetical protein
MKEANRGEGGKVLWAYRLEPDNGGSRLFHKMQVLAPDRGVVALKAMYKAFSLPRKQREGVQTSLKNIKAAAEAGASAPAPATVPAGAADPDVLDGPSGLPDVGAPHGAARRMNP